MHPDQAPHSKRAATYSSVEPEQSGGQQGLNVPVHWQEWQIMGKSSQHTRERKLMRTSELRVTEPRSTAVTRTSCRRPERLQILVADCKSMQPMHCAVLHRNRAA